MTNVQALKALYTAQGGSADLSGVNDIIGVLNAISGLLGGSTTATTNAEAIYNIAQVAVAPTKQTKTVNPSTSKQNITADTLPISPNASGGLTPLSPPSELQEIPVAIREHSGVLCFHSR